MPTTEELASINPGDAITAAYLSRFAMEINLLRREVDELKRERDGGRVVESVPVELTGLETAGGQIFTARTITTGLPDVEETSPDIDSLGTVSTDDNAVVINLGAINGAAIARYLGTREDGTIVLAAHLPSVEVTLTTASGSDGTASAAPTYAYNARDANGNLIASAISPGHNRPIGKTLAGTRGRIAYFDGSPVLVETDEAPNFAEC